MSASPGLDPSAPCVVVGGGPAAAMATRVLARADVPVVVITAEADAPYDRTALSKRLLTEPGAAAPALWQDDEDWRPRVDLRLETRVDTVDPIGHTITTHRGEVITFGRLLLATGAEPRRLDLPGSVGTGVHYLRDTRDAAALSADLARAQQVVVVGGGVIGLEVAASAATLGRDVEVVEAAPRVLGRGVPVQVAEWLVALHRSHGVRIRAGIGPAEVIRAEGRVTGVRLLDGTHLPADVVIIGVGVLPRDELACDAGLLVDDGIVVDRAGRTSHADIFAAGDVARMKGPDDERGVRSESYQAAGQHGEVAAMAMLGGDAEYRDVPWTWSDQYDAVLQSAGLPPTGSTTLLCGNNDAVLVLSFVDRRLVAACGVAHGTAIARPVRTAQLVIAAGGEVDVAALEAAAGDLPGLTRLLRSAARGSTG
jgi:3-phenylpropionate/trans-cinnamate dioxygenase ferredoxin reductase component